MPAPKKNIVSKINAVTKILDKAIAKSNAKPPKMSLDIKPAAKKLKPVKPVKPELKKPLTSPKSNVKVVKKEGPLTAKATEARRVRDAKYRMIELKNPKPKFK